MWLADRVCRCSEGRQCPRDNSVLVGLPNWLFSEVDDEQKSGAAQECAQLNNQPPPPPPPAALTETTATVGDMSLCINKVLRKNTYSEHSEWVPGCPLRDLSSTSSRARLLAAVTLYLRRRSFFCYMYRICAKNFEIIQASKWVEEFAIHIDVNNRNINMKICRNNVYLCATKIRC